MKRLLLHLTLASLLPTMWAHAQVQQCVQSEFSGEAAQDQQFSQELGGGLVFSVVPMLNPPWSWFKIRLTDESHFFVFNPSDENWFLATPDWGSAFIGGPRSDQRAALEYRHRLLAFPLSFDDKETLRKTIRILSERRTPEEERSAIVALKSRHLGQITFDITDDRLANGDPPKMVESVKFNAIITVPAEFRVSEKLVSAKRSLRYVNCPAIPDTVIDDLRNPHRHEYFLPPETTTGAKQ